MAEILRARVFARVFAIVILWLSARRRPGHRPSGIKGTDVMGKPSDPCSLTATQSVSLILDGSLRAQDVTEPASRTVPSVNRPSRLRAFRSRICTEVGGVGPRRPGEGSSNQDQGRARHRRYAQSVRVTVWGELATQGGIPHLWLGQGQPERCFTPRLSQQYGERHAGAAGAADGAGGTTGTRARHRTLGIRRSDGDTGQRQNAGSGRRRRRFGRTAWGKGSGCSDRPMEEPSKLARTMPDDRKQGEVKCRQQLGKTRARRVWGGLCLHGSGLSQLIRRHVRRS